MSNQTPQEPASRPKRRYFTGTINEPAQWQVYLCSCGRWLKAHSAKHWTMNNWQHSPCKNATCNKKVNLHMGKIHLFDDKAEAEHFIHLRSCEERLRQLEVKLWEKIQRKKQGFEDEWSEDLFEQFMNETGYLNRELWNDIQCIPDSYLQLQFLDLYLRTKHSIGKMDDAKIRQVVEHKKTVQRWGQGKTRLVCMMLIKRWCE